MCGIAGILGEHAAQRRDAVRRMVEALDHRGPDGSGLHTTPSGDCVLGHTRLSILDVSAAARQPFVDASGRHALTYNGECYNYRELRAEFESRGVEFESTGDTEVVLRALIERGVSVLPELNGMFTFGFFDDAEGALWLARDRFGQKPLYYTEADGYLVFASEVRALLASGLVPHEADPEAIVGYLSFGSVPDPQTIVRGVQSLPPGSFLRARADGTRRVESFWTPPLDKQASSYDELKASFAGAVERHLVSDVPVGAFLSGGIDSTAVTMAAAMRSGQKVKTLCVTCPDQPNLSEQRFARAVADRAGTEHIEVPFTEREQIALIPEALDGMDQPTVDGVNTFVVSVAARQAGLKVALSGLGGDELFGGYRSSFTETLQLERLHHRLGPCRGLAARALEWLPRFATLPSKLADALRSPGDLLSAYLVRRKLFPTSQAHALFPGLIAHGFCDGLPAAQHAALRELVAERDPTDAIGLLEMNRYMGQQLLRDTDAMGMSQSLEIRVPFLDAEFADRVLRLDASARTPTDVPKHHLVQSLGDWLPDDIVLRKKQGFRLPFEDAMLGPLHEQVVAGLRGLWRLGAAIDLDAVQRFFGVFCRNPERVGWSRVWSLFVLARYLETHDLHFDPVTVPRPVSNRPSGRRLAVAPALAGKV